MLKDYAYIIHTCDVSIVKKNSQQKRVLECAGNGGNGFSKYMKTQERYKKTIL